MSVLGLFRWKTEPESLPTERYEERRLKEIGIAIARLDSELEILDQKLEQFFGGRDPRLTAVINPSAPSLFLIENYAELRVLDLKKAKALAERDKLIAERVGLLLGGNHVR
jgi:hypothetical protein